MVIRNLDDIDIRSTFQAIYRMVSHIHYNHSEPIERFTSSVKRALRSQGYSVTPLYGLPHFLRINGCLILTIISTTEDMPAATKNLQQALKSDETIDSGYIVQLSSPPLWKKVRVSKNHK
ncbi:MAG: hypothetical protein ACOYYS_08735 [Chloroflexota bacterium]